MPKMSSKGKKRLKMRRLSKYSILLATLLVLSCLSRKDNLNGWATALALKEDLTESNEAVVWMRGPLGNLSSHWIKNDVSGVIVVASRDDGVIPIDGALWRFPTEDTEEDYDWLVLEDLITGETMSIPLEESLDDAPTEPVDGGTADGGMLSEAEADTDESDGAGSENNCEIRTIQALPIPLGVIGPYLFAQYNEKQYDCQENLLLSEDKYVTVNLVERTAVDILTDEELETLEASEEVRDLEREGSVDYMGASPIYNGIVEPSLSHIFATRAVFDQENGDHHSVISTCEIIGKKTPKAIEPFNEAPELVLAFAALYPVATVAGWWPVIGDLQNIQKQLAAFGVRRE